MKRLLLITASAPGIKKIRKARVIKFQQITMPYLAALTPSGWNVQHIDEDSEAIDFDSRIDLVGITFHTPSADYVYSIASRFRKRGVSVVLGGPHVTLVPEEAAKHADVIFIGEAEGLWQEFLADFEKGSYKNRYEQSELPSLINIPMSCKDLFHRKDYSGGVLFATRGCPNKCDFCTLSVMYKNVFRKRPIEEVAAEYGSFKGKVIIFWDDNIAADLEYAKKLFKAIMPYNKWWSSQASIHAGKDDKFLELAARSGCKQLFLGLESINQNSLNGSTKGFNRVVDYNKIIDKIHSYGISVQVGIVFGFDEDTKSVFNETIDFLEATGIQNATFNMLIPYPGTPLFNRLEGEGRILTHDWSKYNGRTDVAFTPRNMSAQELLDGFNYVNRRFYSLRSIAKRLSRSPVGLWWTLPLNLSYYTYYKLHGPRTNQRRQHI